MTRSEFNQLASTAAASREDDNCSSSDGGSTPTLASSISHICPIGIAHSGQHDVLGWLLERPDEFVSAWPRPATCKWLSKLTRCPLQIAAPKVKYDLGLEAARLSHPCKYAFAWLHHRIQCVSSTAHQGIDDSRFSVMDTTHLSVLLDMSRDLAAGLVRGHGFVSSTRNQK